jgi:iron complex outermembrane receptor protein
MVWSVRQGVADFDFTHRYALRRRHDLIWGLGYRFMQDRTVDGGRLNRPEFRSLPEAYRTIFQPESQRDSVYSLFVQDDISLVADRVILTLGSKLQHHPYAGLEVQPSARLLWSPNAANGLWVSVSRAVRTPARRDRDAQVAFAMPAGPLRVYGVITGSKDFAPEDLLAYEAGHRRMLGRTLSVDFALFFNRYGNLQSTEMAAARWEPPAWMLPLVWSNTGRARTYGFEKALSWTPHARWRLYSSYSLFLHRYSGNSGLVTPAEDGRSLNIFDATPRQQFTVRSLLDLPGRWNFDATTYCSGRIALTGTPAHARVDLRVSRRLGESLDLSVGVNDLFSRQHSEYIVEDSVMGARIRRNVFLQTRWMF